ncbi:MAG: hypothetical protein OEM59_15460 [Rhodospirillales bacterium]|nr:hypothetical protein [Rhodospirillales bacterium]
MKGTLVRAHLPATLGLALSLALYGAFPGAARAEVELYVAGGAAGSVIEHFSAYGPSAGYEFQQGDLPNYVVPSAAGLDFGTLRLEGEALVREDALDGLNLSGLDLNPSGNLYTNGNFETMAGMANALVDLPSKAGISPFFGGGVGYADVSAHDLDGLGMNPGDDRDGVLAYQLRAGLSFSVLSATEVTFGYRYFVTEDLSLTGAGGDAIEVDEQASHIGELGIRIKF